MVRKLKEKIKALPDFPGVYIFKSARGHVLYVGKALSLRKRVSSYFAKTALSTKTGFLIEKARSLDFIVCDTEAQALILEASLIKEHKPRYNVALRDDKSYPFIEVTKEDFPCIFPSRPKRTCSSVLFGPYPNATLAREALRIIRNIFPYRSCKRMPKKVCLFFHLDLCPAPCVGNISKNEYREIVGSICTILSGNKKSLIHSLENKMVLVARDKRFEEAASLRDKLTAIYNLYSGKAQLHQIILLKQLLKLSKLPLVIEAIDISNLTGKEATGSVVVFKDGVPDKSRYRRYRIKGVHRQNDYDMIAEVVRRRYSRLREEKKALPQLIIIDGGKAHVNRAKKELEKLKVRTPVIGIAKRNEEIWFSSAAAPMRMSKNNQALFLIQRLRDEAHRFAHTYHTLLRKKKMLPSSK